MKLKTITILSYLLSIFSVHAEINSRISNIPIYHNVPQYISAGFNIMSMEKNGELKVISDLIYPWDVVFDVGASRGEWSEYVLSNVFEPDIYAFEPIPDSFALLKNNLGNQVKAYQIGLSNTIGKKTIHCYLGSLSHNQLSSFYERPILSSQYHFTTKPIEIITNTIDSFCKTKKIHHIDLLKIDTEGAEYEILLGAEEMLKKQKISLIQFEYGGTFLDAKTTLKEVFIFLKNNNYSVFRILPDGLLHINKWYPILENYTYSNYLAITVDQAGECGLIENL